MARVLIRQKLLDMIRCGLLGLAVCLFAACTPSVTVADRVTQLAQQVDSDAITVVHLSSTQLAVDSDAERVSQDASDSGAAGTREEIASDASLAGRPIADFNLPELSARLAAIGDCPSDMRPTVWAISLAGGGLLVKDGCAQFGTFDVHATLLDARALSPFDGFSAEVIDEALDDLELAIGPTAAVVEIFHADHSAVWGFDSISAFAPSSTGCLPGATRFGGHDASSGIGLLLGGTCNTIFTGGDAVKESSGFPWEDISGAAVVAAMDRLTAAMRSVPGFSGENPGPTWWSAVVGRYS